MTANTKAGPGDARWIPMFWSVVALGGLIGYLLCGDVFESPPPCLVTSLCLGLVWAYLFIQWMDMFGEALSFYRDPVPLSLDPGDREAVKEHLAKLTGRQNLPVRARHLLQAWSLGWNPRQVLDLAAFQSRRATSPHRTGTVFMAVLLLVCYALDANPWLTWGGVIMLALTVLARQVLLQRTDQYLEGHLLTRLPAHIPGTAMTAAELARALGGSIQSAFKDSVPQPEKTAAAMKEAVESVVRNVATEVARLEKTLSDSQSSLVDKWTRAATATTSDLKSVEKALGGVATDLTGGLRANAEKMEKMFSGHTHDLDKALGGTAGQVKEGLQEHTKHLDKVVGEIVGQVRSAYSEGAGKLQAALGAVTDQMGKATGSWSGNLQQALAEQTAKLTAATQALSGQLEKIAALEKDIEKVLHVQEVVDSSMKAVASSDEFKKTLETLRTHLEESDKLLREVSRPRTIRLIEREGDAEEK
ncbi:MAG: hypothetical protein V1873_02705 [Verrucomicrobiota bacterium]